MASRRITRILLPHLASYDDENFKKRIAAKGNDRLCSDVIAPFCDRVEIYKRGRLAEKADYRDSA